MVSKYSALPALSAFTLLLAACGGDEGNALPPDISGAAPPASGITLSAQAALGEKIFHDPSLSSSGQLSCASCHVPDHAFAGDQPTSAVRGQFR